jgi:methyl-accepting chemotaxis protein
MLNLDLRTLRVATRIRILATLGVVGLLVLTIFMLFNLKDTMIEDRRDKIVNLVNSAYSMVKALDGQVKSGTITLEEAQTIAKAFIRHARYDEDENNNYNYLFVVDKNHNYVVFPPEPKAEGIDVKHVQENATRLGILRGIVGAGRSSSHGGFFSYQWPKPPATEPIEKITYSNYYEPWDWTIITGIYLDDVSKAFSNQTTFIILATTAIAVLLFIGATMIGRGILKQLGGEISDVVESTRAIARGDLTSPIDANPSLTLSLANSIATMQNKLKEIVVAINGMVDQLASNAVSLADSSAKVSDTINAEARSTQSIAAMIEEMSGNIGKVSEMASVSAKNAIVGNEVSEKGATMAGKQGGVINVIAETVESSSNKIELLQQKSVEIGGIANVIRDIADQTNLLALNAAIEAARAGDQGRGFAVVADEVRKLAERTAKATNEIGVMISTIQEETAQAVEAMRAVKPQVENGLQLSNEIKAMLEGIHKEASASLQSARNIADATREEVEAANAVSKDIEEIAALSTQADTTMKGNAASAGNLEQMADKLKGITSFFKT